MHDLRNDVSMPPAEQTFATLAEAGKKKRYNPNIAKLLEARHRCRGVTADYNELDTKTTSYNDIFKTRLEMLRKVVGKVGSGTFIEPPFLPDYGCNIVIGNDCFINFK